MQSFTRREDEPDLILANDSGLFWAEREKPPLLG